MSQSIPTSAPLSAEEIKELKSLYRFAFVGELEFDSNEAQYRVVDDLLICARKNQESESVAVLALFEDEMGQSRNNFAHFLVSLYNAFPSILVTLGAANERADAAGADGNYWKWIGEVAVLFIEHDAPESAKQALKEPEALWRQWFDEGMTPFEAMNSEMESWDE